MAAVTSTMRSCSASGSRAAGGGAKSSAATARGAARVGEEADDEAVALAAGVGVEANDREATSAVGRSRTQRAMTGAKAQRVLKKEENNAYEEFLNDELECGLCHFERSKKKGTQRTWNAA